MIKNQQYYLDNFNRYIDNRLLEINAIILLITYSIYGIPIILCDVLINKEGYKYAIKGYPNSNAIYLHKEAINDTPDNVIRMGLYSEYYAYKSFGE